MFAPLARQETQGAVPRCSELSMRHVSTSRYVALPNIKEAQATEKPEMRRLASLLLCLLPLPLLFQLLLRSLFLAFLCLSLAFDLHASPLGFLLLLLF